MRTRPAAINSSHFLREPTPAAARNRFKRTLQIWPKIDVDLAKARLRVRLRFGETDNFAAFFPLAAFLEEFDPLETLQNIAFRDDGAGSSETSMLRHRAEMSANTSARSEIFKCPSRLVRKALNYN